MNVEDVSPPAKAMDTATFREFYRGHLPEVYGYLLRLCGGDVPLAEDLNQDVWFALVSELSRGNTERADVRWLITVARSRFVDHARRQRLVRSKLQLLRSPPTSDLDPAESDLLADLSALQPLHRAVLIMRYLEDLPVPQIAAAIDRPVSATNSLLARARADLRSNRTGAAHE